MNRFSIYVVFILLLAVPAAGQNCEIDRPVMFAGLDWNSSRIHVAIASHILEHGYGCETDSLPVSTLPAVAGMVRGDVDVMMEVWTQNIPEAWEKGLASGKVVEVGINFSDSVQAWFVPRYLVEGDEKRGIEPSAPGLRSVADLLRYKELFRDPEEPSKGRFYNCVLGWACETVNTKKLRVYGLENHYTNFRPGTGEALSAAIASNYKRGRPMLTYYWGPTWVLGSYDLLPLEEPAYEPEAWNELRSSDHPKRATAYPPSEVSIGVNRTFHDATPELMKFFASYRTENEMLNGLLAKMIESKAREEEIALDFLRTRPEVWKSWVPSEVAARVEKSLR